MFYNTRGIDFDDLTTTERDALVLPATGLLIYNNTTGQTEVNTGTPAAPVWSGTVAVANQGQVKVNGSGGVKPSYALTAGVEQIVDYGVAALDFSSAPTNEWPQNISSPTDSDIWDSANTGLIENTILGQTNIWRIILNYSNKQLNAANALAVILRNPLSGFIVEAVFTLPEGTTNDDGVSLILATIADGASLPSPLGTGNGYEFVLDSDVNITIEVDSVTRISLHHNPR